jgi:predicted DNA binding CopG/RHH family protein
MAKKTVQYMSKAQIEAGLKMSIRERLRFLEQFRRIAAGVGASKSKLISIKIPEDLLHAFRQKCELENLTYQTQIKDLMRQWLTGDPGQ